MLRDPFDDNVIPIVAELERRLPQDACQGQGEEEEEHPGVRNDTDSGEENGDTNFWLKLLNLLGGSISLCYYH